MSRTTRKPHVNHSLSCLPCGTVSDGPVSVDITAETQWCKRCNDFTPHASDRERGQEIAAGILANIMKAIEDALRTALREHGDQRYKEGFRDGAKEETK